MYRFTLVYKPGKENMFADMLSRLPDEDSINCNPNDDYFDQLIVMIDEDEDLYQNDDSHAELNQFRSSNQVNQDEDTDIIFIKNLILENGDDKPKITTFENDIPIPSHTCLLQTEMQ